MKNKYILLIAAIALFAYSCHNNTESAGNDITISPESGSRYKAGDEVTVKVNLPKGAKLDSIIYLLDSVCLFFQFYQRPPSRRKWSIAQGSRESISCLKSRIMLCARELSRSTMAKLHMQNVQ